MVSGIFYRIYLHIHMAYGAESWYIHISIPQRMIAGFPLMLGLRAAHEILMFLWSFRHLKMEEQRGQCLGSSCLPFALHEIFQ